MNARQDGQSDATATPTVDTDSFCAPLLLPAHGYLALDGAQPTQLATEALYTPSCSSYSEPGPGIIVNNGFSIGETTPPTGQDYSKVRDPFAASIFPQCYALAATTVLAYVLFLMLIIVPRSFLDGGVVVLGRRGFTNGPSNGIDIGGRPWLQKVASLTVAISLTIASVDTFRVAERQYHWGWGVQNASDVQAEVLGGTELKVIQLISDTFLWLAQAQTLIRLFPRQREKIIIKWAAFSLISLDVIFGALNSFHYTGPGNVRPNNFTEAVPALSYLFQLSLGLLYAAWVIYYSIMKKRYAFYHPLMKNISLMAMLSIFSILVPVVFFTLDIIKPEFTGWGEYVRWVGAAAASVVVWEWVERIEALEREEKKDGILGREVFDGDEMMDVSPSGSSWPRRRKNRRTGKDDGGENGGSPENKRASVTGARDRMWPAMSSIANRYKPKSDSSPTAPTGQQRSGANATTTTGSSSGGPAQPPLWPSRPQPAVTPVSRTDSTSAESTVYAVHYQPLTETTSRTAEDNRLERTVSRSDTMASPTMQPRSDIPNDTPASPHLPEPDTDASHQRENNGNANGPWHQLAGLNPFRGLQNRHHGPPAEVLPHTAPKQPKPSRVENNATGNRWDVRSRVEDFAASRAERLAEKFRGAPDNEDLPVTVIPAPPRRGAALARVQEEEGASAEAANGTSPQISVASPPLWRLRSPSLTSESVPLSPFRSRQDSGPQSSTRPLISPRESSYPFGPTNGANNGDATTPSPRSLEPPANDLSRSGVGNSNEDSSRRDGLGLSSP